MFMFGILESSCLESGRGSLFVSLTISPVGDQCGIHSTGSDFADIQDLTNDAQLLCWQLMSTDLDTAEDNLLYQVRQTSMSFSIRQSTLYLR